jgi:hypothetical protein
VPSDSTTSQCHLLHGSRSMRAGIRVVMVSCVIDAISTSKALRQG